MRSSTYLNTALALSTAGLLFSGYLSAVKLFTATCAFGETCPLFLGLPACWFGFLMYLVMFLVSLFGVFGRIQPRRAAWGNAVVSFVGILFAGYLTTPEIGRLISGTTYSLGLPTCAYGLIFYTIIFVVSVWFLFRARSINARA